MVLLLYWDKKAIPCVCEGSPKKQNFTHQTGELFAPSGKSEKGAYLVDFVMIIVYNSKYT